MNKQDGYHLKYDFLLKKEVKKVAPELYYQMENTLQLSLKGQRKVEVYR